MCDSQIYVVIDLDQSEFLQDSFLVYMNPKTGLYKCINTNFTGVITVQSVAGKQYGLVNRYNSTNDMLHRKSYLDADDTFQDALNFSELCELFSSFITYS